MARLSEHMSIVSRRFGLYVCAALNFGNEMMQRRGMKKELDFQILWKIKRTAVHCNGRRKKNINYSNWMKAKINKADRWTANNEEMHINSSKYESIGGAAWQLDEVIKCY